MLGNESESMRSRIKECLARIQRKLGQDSEKAINKRKRKDGQESEKAWPGFNKSLARIQRKLNHESEKAWP